MNTQTDMGYDEEWYQQRIGWMLDYFREVAAEYPDVPHWSHGLRFVETWQHLCHTQLLIQEDIDRLVDTIYREGYHVGTVWMDMASRFKIWAENKGFVVPQNIPPPSEEYDEITLLTQLLTNYVPTPEVYSRRGWAYYEQQDYDHALTDYNSAIALNPDFVKAYYQRAVVYALQGKCEDAWRDIRHVQQVGHQIPQTILHALEHTPCAKFLDL